MNIFDDTASINLSSTPFKMSENSELRISEKIFDITHVYFLV